MLSYCTVQLSKSIQGLINSKSHCDRGALAMRNSDSLGLSATEDSHLVKRSLVGVKEAMKDGGWYGMHAVA